MSAPIQSKNNRIELGKKEGTMSKSKAWTVVLNLDTSSPAKKMDGMCPFRIMVRLDGKAKAYETGFAYMHREYWVPVEEKQKNGRRSQAMKIKLEGNPNGRNILITTSAKVKEYKDIVEDLEKTGESMTHDVLQQRVEGKKAKSLVEFCRWRISEDKKGMSPDTADGYRMITNNLERFDPNSRLTMITPDWLEKLEKYLRYDHPVYQGRAPKNGPPKVTKYGLKHNSVVNHFDFLAKVLRYATANAFLLNNPMERYKSFKNGKEKLGPRVYHRDLLTLEEVKHLHEVYLSGRLKTYTYINKGGRTEYVGEKYHNILQHMLVAVYTGFRFSDLRQMEDPTKVVVDKDHISLTMKKVKERHKIKITEPLRQVLNLEGGSLFNAKLFRPSAMINNVRRIFPIVGIKGREKFCWHDFRRTFATVLIEEGKSIYLTSKLLGHKQLSTTEKYIKVRGKTLDNTLSEVFDDIGKPVLPPSEEMLEMLLDLIDVNPDVRLPRKVKQLLEAHA